MSNPGAGKTQMTLLMAWHAWLAGAFLVAYLSAGEDGYAVHQFAGYAVLAAIAARLAAGLVASTGSPWRLPRVSWLAARAWLSTRKGRHPLFAALAAVLLSVVGLVAVSGALADGTTWLEDPHEAVAETSLWLVAAHIVFVTYMYAGRKWLAGLGRRVATGRNGSAR
ncbi:MAG: hypothetical protein AB7S58_25325 [Dongiaceae bacterium]